MADASQLQLNPYALFDPSQWQNPFSNYQSSPLPAASYAGMPTDYAGNPIQMPPGMTINQTPAQPAAAAAPSGNPNQALLNTMLQNIYASGGSSSGSGPGGIGAGAPGGSGVMLEQLLQQGAGANPWQQSQAAQPAAAAPAAAPAASAGGLTPQQYMQLRANPGPVPTYGANVPQSASSAQPGTGVLQSFLQNWRPASSGPGSGFQQGFAQALKNQGYS